eukprot:4448366-Amphidinium_carterae.2
MVQGNCSSSSERHPLSRACFGTLVEDGLAKDAPPQDVFTWDTVTTRMPKILDAVLATLPQELQEHCTFA